MEFSLFKTSIENGTSISEPTKDHDLSPLNMADKTHLRENAGYFIDLGECLMLGKSK